MARSNIGKSLRRMRRVEHVRKQLRIVELATKLNPKSAENVERKLEIVNALGNRGIFKERLQLRRKGETQTFARLGTDTDAGFCFGFGFLNSVEK